MAKYRHRVFEMYDFQDEAIDALTPKTVHSTTEDADPEAWNFGRMAVSRLGSVTRVTFKDAEAFSAETLSDLRREFGQLSESLAIDSKVLLDFTGITSLSAASIDVLVQFNKRLRHQGSRTVLCCLDQSAREAFFPPSE